MLDWCWNRPLAARVEADWVLWMASSFVNRRDPPSGSVLGILRFAQGNHRVDPAGPACGPPGSEQRQQVIWLVLGDSLKLVLFGLILGVAGALSVSHLLQSLLFGIGGADLRTIIGVSCLLSPVALLASWWPARRAGRIDPVIALREA